MLGMSKKASGLRFTLSVGKLKAILDFIHRLAAEEGIYYFFEHQNGKHTLVFSDDCAALHDGHVLYRTC